MMGFNRLSKPFSLDGGNLLVHSIFATIQGEGPLTGLGAVFIRMTGCNLHCYFCDTEFETGSQHHPSKLLDQMNELHTNHLIGSGKLCVITGGEPILQPLHTLVQLAIADGWRVQIETAGTLYPEWLTELEPFMESGDLVLVCSPKTPAVAKRMEEHCKHWKYIISAEGEADPGSGLPMARFQAGDLYTPKAKPVFIPKHKGVTIWVQPMDEHFYNPSNKRLIRNQTALEANTARCAKLAMERGYRVSLQTHKLMGLL